MISQIREIVGMAFIIVGIGFDFFGVLGLVRLPDVYNRLQAATKCVTFGTAGLLFGAFIKQGFDKHGLNAFGFKALIGIVFIFLAAPVAAHAIARAAHRSRIPLSSETVIDAYEKDHELKE